MSSEADVEAVREALEASRSALICDERFSRKLDDAQIEGRASLTRISDRFQRYEAVVEAVRAARPYVMNQKGALTRLDNALRALDPPATQECRGIDFDTYDEDVTAAQETGER